MIFRRVMCPCYDTITEAARQLARMIEPLTQTPPDSTSLFVDYSWSRHPRPEEPADHSG